MHKGRLAPIHWLPHIWFDRSLHDAHTPTHYQAKPLRAPAPRTRIQKIEVCARGGGSVTRYLCCHRDRRAWPQPQTFFLFLFLSCGPKPFLSIHPLLLFIHAYIWSDMMTVSIYQLSIHLCICIYLLEFWLHCVYGSFICMFVFSISI